MARWAGWLALAFGAFGGLAVIAWRSEDRLAAPVALAVLGTVALMAAIRSRRERQVIRQRAVADQALARADRILRMRSASNRALVGAAEESALLAEVCDFAVREGGYRMAWIGFAEQDPARTIRPVAGSGEDHDRYLRDNLISWGEGPRGTGPAGRCIRSGQPAASQELGSDESFVPWAAAAAMRGFASVGAIPLRLKEQVVGTLVLYSGEPHAFDAAEMALLGEIGEDVSFGLGVLRNHQAIAAQRRQLLVFRQVLERSNDAVFITDAKTGCFVDFNGTASVWLGYSPEELREMGQADVVPQVGGAVGWPEVVAKIHRERGLVWDRSFRRKDGTTFPVEIALTAIEVEGQTVVLTVARDISERERMMLQLHRAARMESVGRLAGGVAHDFNNLLTVINATAELALSELPSESPVSADLREIRAASDRAAAVTRQLLAFSRQQVMQPQLVPINRLITEFLTMLRRLIGEDVRVEVMLAASEPLVLADPGQLEQVLMNLCINARDAMPGGGVLTIGTATVDLDAEDVARHESMNTGKYLLLSVADTGFGMDRHTQAMIFEPFFTTKELGKGSGLGLPTVYGIVKQSGGSIWVYSEVGQGTTFKIYLPLATGAATQRDPETAPADPIPGAVTGTILIVEDEEAIRLVVRRLLEREGYCVIEATNGQDALARVAAHEGVLDLVMTDVVMPGMTGIELAARLRETHPTLRILLTSGYSADVVSDRFDPGPDWRFISKPYTIRELAAEIRKMLDSAID